MGKKISLSSSRIRASNIRTETRDSSQQYVSRLVPRLDHGDSCTQSPMVASVEVLDRVLPSLSALPHVIRSIDAFLDQSSGWSLESAAANRHLHLMDRLLAQKNEDTFRLARFYSGTRNAAGAGSVEVLAWWMTKYLPGEQPSYNQLARDAASLGHVCILQWLQTEGLFPNPGISSMATNQAQVVYWLHAQPELNIRLSVCMCTAAEAGDLVFLKWLQQHQGELDVSCTGDALMAANERGDLEMLQWLMTNRPELVPNADEWLSESYGARRCRQTVQERPSKWPDQSYPEGYSDLPEPLELTDGHLQVYQWIRTEYKWSNRTHAERWAQKVAMHAVACNNIPTIEILKEREWLGATYTYETPLWVAARYGHLNMVQWMSHEDSSQCYIEAMKGAAVGGHLDILQWLQQRKAADSIVGAMDLAAFGGHLQVIQWMHQAHSSDGNHESFLCSSQAMDAAAAQGHLDVVQWLNENRTEGCTSAAIKDAAANGHLSIVQYLHEHFPVHFSPVVMDAVATNGHLDILKFLHLHHPRGWTSNGTTGAASNGHLETVRWMYEQWPLAWRKNAIDEAARNGHVKVVEFLALRGQFKCRPRGRTDAKHRGHFAVLEWLDAHKPDQ